MSKAKDYETEYYERPAIMYNRHKILIKGVKAGKNELDNFSVDFGRIDYVYNTRSIFAFRFSID